MPISERWRKFPASRLSRFAVFAGIGLAGGAIRLVGYNLSWIRDKGPSLYEFVDELSFGLAIATILTVGLWLYDLAERGEITKSQRYALGLMLSFNLMVWIALRVVGQSVDGQLLGIGLMLSWGALIFLVSLVAARKTDRHQTNAARPRRCS